MVIDVLLLESFKLRNTFPKGLSFEIAGLKNDVYTLFFGIGQFMVLCMEYDELFTFSNLYKAYLKSRSCKRNKKEIIEFELSPGSNIYSLFLELKERKYKIQKYHTFFIYEPKKRQVDALSFKDRIVQHCLCDNYIMPILEKRLIYDNAACRVNKGTDFARKRLRKFYHDYYKYNSNDGYVLKCDIHHFFESINHDKLKELISKTFDNKDIVNLMYEIIDSYHYKENIGLPIGNQTSQAFAILYLDEMDRMIKEKYKIKSYIRYMDDFILIHNDKEYLERIIYRIKELLDTKYYLELNPKTRIYKLNENIEFLGFKFRLCNYGKIIMRLDSRKKRTMIKKIKIIKSDYLNKTISKESYDSSIASYLGYVKKGCNYLFEERIKEEVHI